jgi:Cu(I)/Ag(I) efflux system membrane fusion protein
MNRWFHSAARSASLLAGPLLLALTAACDSAPAAKGDAPGAAVGPPTLMHQGPGLELLRLPIGSPAISFAVVQRVALPGDLETTGQVAFDDRRVASIISRVTGRIEEVRVSQWDYVRRGQSILTLYSPDFMTAEAEYLQAKAAEPALANGGTESVQFARAMVEAARRKLELLGITPDQIEAIKTAAPSFAMRAPISGNIVQSQTLRGAAVNAGDVLYSVGTLDDVWITADIYEDDLSRVRVGQHLDAVTTAYPDDVFHGVIDRISPNVDPNTHTMQLRCAVQNPGFKLKPQMLARVRIAVPTSQVLIVPREALVFAIDDYFAYVDAGDDRLARRKVAIGSWSRLGFARVLSGLVPGDRVVTREALQVDQLWHEAHGDNS